MEYIKKIALDLNAASPATVIKAKQGDNSTRFINIVLTRDHVPVSPEEGSEVMFRLEKSDGTAVLNRAVIEDDGTVTAELTGQCTAVAGKAKADVSILYDGRVISSASFFVEVLESPDVADRASSIDEFGFLHDEIAKAEAAIGGIDEAVEEMRQETADAIAEMQEAVQEATEEMEETMRTAFDRKKSVTFSGDWSGDDPYLQEITVEDYDVTPNTVVDLVGTEEVVSLMKQDDVERLLIVNDGGTLTAYAYGNAFTQGFTAEAYMREIIAGE